MSHVSHDSLWSFAERALAADEAAGIRAHLEFCAGCQARLDEVRAAQALLHALPDPPPLPEDLARRVGRSLGAAIEQPEPRWRAWLRERGGVGRAGWGGWALTGAGAAVALAFVVSTWTRDEAPSTGSSEVAALGVPPTPVPQEHPGLAGSTPPPAAAPNRAGRLSARVTSAKKATSGSTAVATAQSLDEGATVKTERGGRLWMRLPDGTRAGLTGHSEVKLTALEPAHLALEVTRGSLAMLVPHRTDRVLTVRAGELEVRDLGTRFVVSHEAARVLVVVEEGSVELTVPGRTETLYAGQAADWRNGRLALMPWQPPLQAGAAAGAPKQQASTEADTQLGSIARLDDEDDEAVPPPQSLAESDAGVPGPRQASAEQATAPPAEPPTAPLDGEEPEEERWAQLPPGATAGRDALPAPPAEATTATAPRPMVGGGPPRADDGFGLRTIERQLELLRRQIGRVDLSVDSSPRESRAREVSRLADQGDCVGALQRAEEWLTARPGSGPEELVLKRQVLFQKVRCLNRTGRVDEALRTQKALKELTP